MKYVIVVPDGMADRPLKELGGRTPLEAAKTPNMDAVARGGACGMAKTFYSGLPYDSSIANMGILGYDPRKYFTGRSPLEAANLGVVLEDGDLALRCNLITVADGRIKDFTAGHISRQEGSELIEALKERLGVAGLEFYPGVSYRNLLVIRKRLRPSDRISTKPPHDIVGGLVSRNMVKATSKRGEETARLLNRLIVDSASVLEDHPVNGGRKARGKNVANSVWFWGAGTRPDLPSFEEKFGMKGSLVSAVDLLKGIGKTIGLDVLDVKGATGYIDTNYIGKADAALDSLKRVDFTYVHIESTDEAGHEGSIEHKIRAIEDIDRNVVGEILGRMGCDFRMLLLPDHATPIEIRTHTKEPIPYAIYDSTKESVGACAFTEREIRKRSPKKAVESYRLMGLLRGD
ncbi:MAG: cofactor-independent phosphoglycerate mutase [Candidatus Altiarchaeota archaeon]